MCDFSDIVTIFSPCCLISIFCGAFKLLFRYNEIYSIVKFWNLPKLLRYKIDHCILLYPWVVDKVYFDFCVFFLLKFDAVIVTNCVYISCLVVVLITYLALVNSQLKIVLRKNIQNAKSCFFQYKVFGISMVWDFVKFLTNHLSWVVPAFIKMQTWTCK